MQSSRLVSAFVKGLLALSVLPSILANDLAHAVRITNEPNGFNEYTWGAPLASFPALQQTRELGRAEGDRKSTRLNSSHGYISYAVFCLKKKKKKTQR